MFFPMKRRIELLWGPEWRISFTSLPFLTHTGNMAFPLYVCVGGGGKGGLPPIYMGEEEDVW